MWNKSFITFSVLAALLALSPANAEAATKKDANKEVGVGEVLKPDPELLKGADESAMVDVQKIPFVRQMLQNGAELYFLGQRSGMLGFLVYVNDQIQVFYITPDKQALIVGGMFTIDGSSISEQQLRYAVSQNKELENKLKAASQQAEEIGRVGNADVLLKNDSSAMKAGSKLPTAPLSPGERLYNDFMNAPGQVMGDQSRPTIMALVDPHCPHCKATWGVLKDLVAQKVVQVKLVPVAREGSQSEKEAAVFLASEKPYDSWTSFAAGDAKALSGEPTDIQLKAVRGNMKMAEGWKITSTPFLVYRAKDGKVKFVEGRPEKISTIIDDMK